MERIGLIGINWKQVGTSDIAEFGARLTEGGESLQPIASELGVSELVCLKTCNRVELAVVVDRPDQLTEIRKRVFQALTGRESKPGEAERALRVWGGEGAVEHLFLVTAGLESARLGEREIVGQVRRSADIARDRGTLGPRLDLVFGEALKVAKRVHEATSVGHGRASLAEIGLEEARRHLSRRPGLVAVIGVGELARRAVEELSERGIPVLVVNRSEAGAAALAREHDLAYASLEHFLAEPQALSVVISATAAPEPIITYPELSRLSARATSGDLLLVDLAVPADVDAASAKKLGLSLLNMDDILCASRKNQALRHGELGAARVLVDEAVLRIRRRFMERTLAPILAAMQQRYRQTLDEGVRQLLSAESDAQAASKVLDKWSERMANRLAHIPSNALRGVAKEGGLEAVRAFFDGTDPTLEAVVERALTEPERFEPVSQTEEGR
jgi:glutamyl-tRNA reductase